MTEKSDKVGESRQMVDDGLRRDELTEDRIGELIREYGDTGVIRIYTEAERDTIRHKVLSDHPENQDLWVFAYGSLMWNPAFHYSETRSARIFGHHRRFCLWTPIGRGTPERPGLTLGLQQGGSCHGLILRIPHDQIEAETRIVWRREMLAGGYRPVWIQARCAGATGDAATGETVRAITFVANTDHHRFGGGISIAEAVEAIATAEGRLGRCRDYLHNLVLHLDELGIADGQMHRLYKLVEGHSP
ncbi:MAG: gamma-glutamylcyclotransferase [Rhodospirillaceae bacterium]|jgi:glutathione-specific gamma-glutamylcyclotransferase|nr:gamma-glutamylcyclotransferase [Rhodospirillaceae bacterium]MBT4042225.1 gamma-glutamylcyclotransferase [Rhodospirillaceae bacterium]MBT4687749.1 gamma-glutamylcyclotransferase [Rhodospirillaceae bacterium]MBT5082827.1 gamma-glutamylcyclotransferase [Rhodospirillaceae bacterium]MBT5524271.1 gamma-glutamylcyclotransferase [Rhodospirillaceae bacterium]